MFYQRMIFFFQEVHAYLILLIQIYLKSIATSFCVDLISNQILVFLVLEQEKARV